MASMILVRCVHGGVRLVERAAIRDWNEAVRAIHATFPGGLVIIDEFPLSDQIRSSAAVTLAAGAR
jgi:hypothetical protein